MCHISRRVCIKVDLTIALWFKETRKARGNQTGRYLGRYFEIVAAIYKQFAISFPLILAPALIAVTQTAFTRR